MRLMILKIIGVMFLLINFMAVIFLDDVNLLESFIALCLYIITSYHILAELK